MDRFALLTSSNPITVDTPIGGHQAGYYLWPLFFAVVLGLLAAGCTWYALRTSRDYGRAPGLALGMSALFGILCLWQAVVAYQHWDHLLRPLGGVIGALPLLALGVFVLVMWIREA